MIELTQHKYISIVEEMEKYIRRSSVGQKLPSDRALARKYNCSPLTVRKALDVFVRRGLIVRRIGSGTFVSEKQGILQNLSRVISLRPKVGVLIHSLSDAYGMMVVSSIRDAALSNSVDLEFACISGFGDECLNVAEDFYRKGCVSIIVSWLPFEQKSLLVDFLRKSPLPVSLPLLIPGYENNCFEKAEIFGKGTAIQTVGLCLYFKDLGLERIALLGPNSMDDSIMHIRLLAYSDFVYRNAMENISGLVGKTVEDMDKFALIIKKYSPSVGVICHDDLHAIRLMTAMRKLGLSAPLHYRVIGCNNSNESKFTDPPLSTIYDDYKYLGEGLIKTAIGLSRGKIIQSETPNKHYLLVRESCGGKTQLSSSLRNKLHNSGLIIRIEKT